MKALFGRLICVLTTLASRRPLPSPEKAPEAAFALFSAERPGPHFRVGRKNMSADLVASVYESMVTNGPYHLADTDEVFFRLEDVPDGYTTVLLGCFGVGCGKCMSRDSLLKACPICGRDVCELFESVCTCGTRMYACQGYEDTMCITAIVLPTVTYELGKGEEDVV